MQQWQKTKDLKVLHFKFSLNVFLPRLLSSAAASDEDQTDHKRRRLDTIGDQANSDGK